MIASEKSIDYQRRLKVNKIAMNSEWPEIKWTMIVTMHLKVEKR